MKPDEEHQRRQNEAIAKRALHAAKQPGRNGMKEIIERTSALPPSRRSGTARRIWRRSLPPAGGSAERDPAEHHALKIIAGRELWIRTIPTNKIVYADIAFTIDDLTEEEMLLFNLYTCLVQTTGLGELPYETVAQRIKRLTGGFLSSSRWELPFKERRFTF